MPDAAAVFGEADLVLKVKEPQPDGVSLLRPEQILFTFLHLAADGDLTGGLCESSATCIAYETVEDSLRTPAAPRPDERDRGSSPPRRAPSCWRSRCGGRGILLGGVPGVATATVMIIGGGVVGMNAAFIAVGMEAEVLVFDKSIDRLRELDVAMSGTVSAVYSSTLAIEEITHRADLVIGAVQSTAPGLRVSCAASSSR